MKLYEVTQNLEDPHLVEDPRVRYFGSRGEARKYANQVIREGFAWWKENHGIDRVADMSHADAVVIKEVITSVNRSTKAMFLQMLNLDGGYFTSERVIEQWNPQEKWHTPREEADELSHRSEAHSQESA